MIIAITDIDDPLTSLIDDDPNRPNLLIEERLGSNKEILVWTEDENPLAVLCITYQDFVPANENELISSDTPNIAVFYTIWSYKPGAGKKLLVNAKEYIKNNRPEINRFVTLSPQTDIARKFHKLNGAKELRVNEDSVNYEYL